MADLTLSEPSKQASFSDHSVAYPPYHPLVFTREEDPVARPVPTQAYLPVPPAGGCACGVGPMGSSQASRALHPDGRGLRPVSQYVTRRK
jgi:hypothetical protein